jgi:hypothetical protein
LGKIAWGMDASEYDWLMPSGGAGNATGYCDAFGARQMGAC